MTTQQQIIAGIVVVVLIIIAFFVSRPAPTPVTSADATTTASAATPSPSSPSKTVPSAQAVSGTVVATTDIPTATTISPYLKKDSANVYIYADTNPSGVDEYRTVPGADPATFVALTSPAVVENPTEKSGTNTVSLGTGSASYYRDKDWVYVFSTFKNGPNVSAGIEVVQGAEPATFKVLDSVYAKDADSVYVLDVPPDSTPHPAGAYSWEPYEMSVVTNADPATFVLVNSAALNYDAHDKARTYRDGIQVGNYPS